MIVKAQKPKLDKKKENQMGDHLERKCTFEPRVIYVMESVEEEKMKLKESYKGKASLVVGVVHILCAIVTVTTYFYGESVSALVDDDTMNECKDDDDASQR